MLGHEKRVLVIGAHPDDEDTDLITVLVRSDGVETAYLSLTRGEGGQNLIGDELGEALGVLRTEELLSARQLDGGRQFFTRAYDFGYSKTLEDTWAHWPRDTILKDVVRVIRQFQPQIIVAIFTGTPLDGHGQHQASGWAAREAFVAAGDPGRFPELQREDGLAPWQAQKLYRAARFTEAARMDTIQTGLLDAAVGKSYHQIAMASRSRHRSQDMGSLQTPGPAWTRVSLLEDRTGAGGSLWAGIDTSAQPQREQTRESRWKMNERGIVLDGYTRVADVVPGQVVEVTSTLWNAGSLPISAALSLRVLDAHTPPHQVAVAPGAMATVVDTVRIPPVATTEPYYLRQPRDGSLYRWGRTPDASLPASPPLIEAEANVDGIGALSREVSYRWRDPAFGERRERMLVVPRVGVRLDRPVFAWPVADRAPRSVTVLLRHGAADTTAGVVRLELPAGWPSPPPQPFRLTRQGAEAAVTFSVVSPVGTPAGAYEIRAVAVATDGTRYGEWMQVVDYPHIARRGLNHPASGTVRLMDIAIPDLRAVGYVRGPADGVPDALAALGVPIVELGPDSLARGDLGRYDAIIIGSRAYETVPALSEANARLLEYAAAGGLVLVQYQQYDFFRGGFAPYPLEVGGVPLSGMTLRTSTGSSPGAVRPDAHDRVADESAPVRIIAPASPAVRTPNAIGAADWEGWVQERGLYFARSWAPEYRPVLEMHDPGEPPLEGGLLIAPVGHGTYVYTGLSFHRQLPAGTPGAYRLFMDLLALRGAAVP